MRGGQSIILSLGLWLAMCVAIPVSYGYQAETVDPYALTDEPDFFVGKTISLPPGRIFIGKPFSDDAKLKHMRYVELDTLGVRFKSQHLENRINLLAPDNSKLIAKLRAIRQKRLFCKLTIKLEARQRSQGGVRTFNYYTGRIVKVTPLKSGKFYFWNDLRSIWQKNVGKTFYTYLFFKGWAPRNDRKLGVYRLLQAESEKGEEAGNIKQPGRNLTPALKKGRSGNKALLKQIKKLEGFCLAEVTIAAAPVQDKHAGKVNAGLAIVKKLTPLKVATDFGAPKPLNMNLKKLDGMKLTDSAQLIKTPRFFAGHTHKLIGKFSLGRDDFRADKQLENYRKVDYSSYGGRSDHNGRGGTVAVVVKKGSAAERTLKKLAYQTPGILTVKLEERKRKLGGIVDVGYYLAKVVGVKLWPEESWFNLRNSWREQIGETVWVTLKIEDIAEKKYQVLPDYLFLKAKSTTQHSAGNPRYPARELNLVIEHNEQALEKIASLLQMTTGFCRVCVEIKEIAFKDKQGKDKNAGVALLKGVEPMKTAALFTELPTSFEKDDVLFSWTPFRKLMPSERDIERWFNDSKQKLKRLQYEDYKRKQEPEPSKNATFRYKQNGKWVYSRQLPDFGNAERPHELWQKGTRKVRRSNSFSYVSGGGAGYISMTTISYGASTLKIPTWHRMLYHQAERKWQKVDTKPTLTYFDEIEKKVQKIRPERNRLVKLILDVEESNKLNNMKASVGRWTDVYKKWATDPSRNNPAAKKRLKEDMAKLAKDKQKLKELEKRYREALQQVDGINKQYQTLMEEIEAFAQGKKELLNH